MRLYFAIIFIALSSALGFGQEAEFSFKEKKTLKFDKTPEGEQLEFYYVFTNSGESPLVITDAKTACPCTKIKFPTTPILPNQTDSIRVVFDTNGKYYWQDRTIELLSNVKKKTELRFKVFVIPKED